MVAIQTKVEPIDRDVRLIIDEVLSPQARSRQLASGARVYIREGDEINRRVLGRIPPRKTLVDGREGAALESVRPDGVIIAEWELVGDLLFVIAEQLRAVSPVRSGRYRASHTLFADGVEVAIGKTVPLANEYVFLSDVPYAVKIEGVPGRPAQSKKAPRGVYQITAAKMNRQYGNVARVRFAWRALHSGFTGKSGNRSSNRVPAIVVTIAQR